MTDSPSAPDDLTELARQRAAARSGGDYATADRLRSQIEDAGWRVIDVGYDFRLEPAHPPDREADGVTYYGSSATVPSRLSEPAGLTATIVLVAGGEVERLSRSIAALRAAPAGVQALVVAGAPDREMEEVLAGLEEPFEVIRLASASGVAGSWNAGIRRAAGRIVVLVAFNAELRGDVASPAASALADQTVAVVGSTGLVSTDLRQWQAPDGAGIRDVDALDAEVVAFRRSDVEARGPLDERFVTPRLLAIWWSLVLREPGQPGEPPRRALAVEMPVSSMPGEAAPERNRAARRDFYRIVDRFGGRRELLGKALTPTVEAATEPRR